ncbi:hypothetical protein PFISCL1PPCAC_10183, partial [Pristionchus fissidentatus]
SCESKPLQTAMSNIAFSRIQRECREVVTNKDLESTGIMIEMMNDQLTRMKGTINGPPDSPYESGKFDLDIIIPENYPFHPPKVKFTTRIWHPNVSSQTGLICLDILKDQWAASLTLRTVLLSVQSLLALPEPKDPQDAVVAKQKMSEPKLFEKTSRFWTSHYAKGKSEKDPDFVSKIAKLKDMGVAEDEAISTLSCCGWDLTKATDYLFS